MSKKRNISGGYAPGPSASPKKSRKVLSLYNKLEIIGRLEKGESAADVSRDLDISSSTIRTFRKNVHEIKEAGKNLGTEAMARTTRVRGGLMDKMENLLYQWIQDQNQKNIHLSSIIIKEKARSIFRKLEEMTPSNLLNLDPFEIGPSSSKCETWHSTSEFCAPWPKTFEASSGWLNRFKARVGLLNSRLQSETTSSDKLESEIYPRPTTLVELKEQKISSSKEVFNFDIGLSLDHISRPTGKTNKDKLDSEIFPTKLQELVEQEGYSPKQVFNVDETGLFWKRVPSRTFINLDDKHVPGIIAQKDRLTLLLGGNAEGDFKLKPMLVYHSENPKAMASYDKTRLPVIWRSNKRAWVTPVIFQDWFNNYFVSAVKRYCKENNLSNRALLILDNAPGHPENIGFDHENIKVIFLPPNTSSMLQPMDQGIIASFKSYYLQRSFEQLVKDTSPSDENSNPLSIKEFWMKFNIMHAINHIAEAWNDVSENNMNAVWRNCWPNCISNYFEDDMSEVMRNIIYLAHSSGFNEVNEADVLVVLHSHSEELTLDELAELSHQEHLEEDEEKKPKFMPTQSLSKALYHMNQMVNIILEDDPDRERSIAAKRAVIKEMQGYIHLQSIRKKQTLQPTIDKYFSKQ